MAKDAAGPKGKPKAKEKAKVKTACKEAQRKESRASSAASAPTHMWLIRYEESGAYTGREEPRMELYTSKQMAIAAADKLLDACAYGGDWRNGLEGLGREAEDNYLETEDYRKTVGDHGPIFRLESGGNSQMLYEVLLDKLLVRQ